MSSRELPPSRSPAGSCVGSNHLVHTYSFTSALHSYISNSSYSRFWQQDASFIFSTLLLNILQFPSSSRLPEALTPSDLLYLPAPPPSRRLPNRSPPPQFSVELDYLADTTNTCSHASVAADGLMATRDGCSSFSLEAGANDAPGRQLIFSCLFIEAKAPS